MLEKHADFLRDFRGDTIHPSTLEVMHELGLLDDFSSGRTRRCTRSPGYFGDQAGQHRRSHAPADAPKFIALMPQWEFLDFIAKQAAGLPRFQAADACGGEGADLMRTASVSAACATIDGRDDEIRADLVVGADGRHSIVREHAGLAVEDLGAPMDVLWFAVAPSRAI